MTRRCGSSGWQRSPTPGPGDLSFLANPRYKTQLASTRAAAVIVNAAAAGECPAAMLVSENPYADYARIAALLYPTPAPVPGVRLATVDPNARIDPTSQIGPQAVLGAGVSIGPRAFVGPHCVIEAGASVAEDVRLVARHAPAPPVNFLGSPCCGMPPPHLAGQSQNSGAI